MPASDARGLALSTGSDLAAEHYRQGVDLLLAAWPGAAEALDQAIAADPGLALARAARGRLHAVLGELSQARACLAMATELVLLNGTARERSHVEILALLAHGEPGEALRQILSHLDEWPSDALILSLPMGAFGLFAFSGMTDHDQARVDLCNRHARSYGAQDWWFLSARGWTEAENGDAVLGRAMLQQAFALRPENANAVHGWAHALYEAGAAAEGEALLADWLPTYDRRGLLHGHLAWHSALLALEAGDAARALDIYATQIAPSVSSGLPINVVSDGASLLWRLDAEGAERASAAWADLAAYAERAFPKPGHPFVDLHMALIEASVGDAVALGRRADANLAMVEAGVSVAGPVVPELCRAVLDFAEGRGLRLRPPARAGPRRRCAHRRKRRAAPSGRGHLSHRLDAQCAVRAGARAPGSSPSPATFGAGREMAPSTGRAAGSTGVGGQPMNHRTTPAAEEPAMARTGFVWDEKFAWFELGNYAGSAPSGVHLMQPDRHVYDPEVVRRFRNLVDASGLLRQLVDLPPRPATEAEIGRVHTPAHIAQIKTLSAQPTGGDPGDNAPVPRGAFELAALAAGGAIVAVDAVMAGEVDNAYALLRPAGHHARPDRSMGFCLFSNAAISGRHLFEKHGLKRVAFIDWDVHHGNGTQAAFYSEPRALTISIHQDRLYPVDDGFVDQIGEGAGRGTNLNVPLPPGCGTEAYEAVYDRVVIPALEAYRPEAIIVPSGFDAGAMDPMGRMMVHSEGYRSLTRKLMRAADDLCQGRIVFIQEGGYSPWTVPFFGLAVLEELSGISTGAIDPHLAYHKALGGQGLLAHQAAAIDAAAQNLRHIPKPA